MSEDEKKAAQAEIENGESKPDGPGAAEQPDAGKSTVRKGGLILAVVIILSLAWYLVADRYTPMTSQARVQGYVVGVAPKVAGNVTAIHVDNNQRVEENQPLFEIDTSQYDIALAKARSDLENARNQVGAGSATVEAAQANLEAAEANLVKAEKDLQRLQRLYEDDPGTISVRRLEISEASLEQAKAGVKGAKADIRRAIEQKGGNDDQSNAILQTAQSAVEKAQLDLSNTTVRASTSGIITDLRAEVGQFAGTGSPVLTLVSLQDVWISAEFTENNLGHMVVGGEVAIVFDSIPGKVFSGEVRSIGIGVSTGQSQPAGSLPSIQNNRDWLRSSQRFPVIISIDADQLDVLESQLRIGGQATVMSFTEGHGFLKLLGRFYIRAMSWFSYLY